MSNRISRQNSSQNSNQNSNDTSTTKMVFADPVAYLAGLGLAAEIVAETSLPAAA